MASMLCCKVELLSWTWTIDHRTNFQIATYLLVRVDGVLGLLQVTSYICSFHFSSFHLLLEPFGWRRLVGHRFAALATTKAQQADE